MIFYKIGKREEIKNFGCHGNRKKKKNDLYKKMKKFLDKKQPANIQLRKDCIALRKSNRKSKIGES